MRLKHHGGMTSAYHKSEPSGQKITEGSQDSGLSFPLQNSPEFALGWREKRLVSMTAGELDRLFDEFTLLVKAGGTEN